METKRTECDIIECLPHCPSRLGVLWQNVREDLELRSKLKSRSRPANQSKKDILKGAIPYLYSYKQGRQVVLALAIQQQKETEESWNGGRRERLKQSKGMVRV